MYKDKEGKLVLALLTDLQSKLIKISIVLWNALDLTFYFSFIYFSFDFIFLFLFLFLLGR